MKVLVTGGLGQIGSHIVELLLKNNKVFVIDNLSTGRKVHLFKNSNLELRIGDISDQKIVEDIMSNFKPEIVVHTAASYKNPNDWYSDVITNCVGGVNIIQSSVKHEVKRFIYLQTALCYGLKPLQNPIKLNHTLYPGSTSYSISKTTNEMYLNISGLNYVTFRLANVIGPRNLAGPLPIFYQRLKDNKKCFVTKSRRDFVYVKDLAKIVVKACNGIGNGTYHFSSGKDIAIEDLYYSVVNAMRLNRKEKIPEIKEISKDDVFSILLDPTKTFNDFGNIKFTPIQKIVNEAVKYYDEFGTTGELSHLKLKRK